MKPKLAKSFVLVSVIALSVASCYSGKIVLSNNVNLDRYKYIIFGNDTSGDRQLDDVLMAVQNQISETNLTVLSASSDALRISECSDSILTPNIHVTSEKWDGGHTYITVTFYDYNDTQPIVVVKGSGNGVSIGHDQSLALEAIRKKLDRLFKKH